MNSIILIAHNLRSTHNVGSLLRTADGLGIKEVLLTGYTPYPGGGSDELRLPHEVRKLDKQIQKTALGAEVSQAWRHAADIEAVFRTLHEQSYVIAALEQAPESVKLPDFTCPPKVALLVGREVEGVEPEVLAGCDVTIEIPMFGAKESFNVAQAAAMALYQLRFSSAA